MPCSTIAGIWRFLEGFINPAFPRFLNRFHFQHEHQVLLLGRWQWVGQPQKRNNDSLLEYHPQCWKPAKVWTIITTAFKSATNWTAIAGLCRTDSTVFRSPTSTQHRESCDRIMGLIWVVSSGFAAILMLTVFHGHHTRTTCVSRLVLPKANERHPSLWRLQWQIFWSQSHCHSSAEETIICHVMSCHPPTSKLLGS